MPPKKLMGSKCTKKGLIKQCGDLVARGVKLLNQNNFVDAEMCFDDALKMCPMFSDALYNKAILGFQKLELATCSHSHAILLEAFENLLRVIRQDTSRRGETTGLAHRAIANAVVEHMATVMQFSLKYFELFGIGVSSKKSILSLSTSQFQAALAILRTHTELDEFYCEYARIKVMILEEYCCESCNDQIMVRLSMSSRELATISEILWQALQTDISNDLDLDIMAIHTEAFDCYFSYWAEYLLSCSNDLLTEVDDNDHDALQSSFIKFAGEAATLFASILGLLGNAEHILTEEELVLVCSAASMMTSLHQLLRALLRLHNYCADEHVMSSCRNDSIRARLIALTAAWRMCGGHVVDSYFTHGAAATTTAASDGDERASVVSAVYDLAEALAEAAHDCQNKKQISSNDCYLTLDSACTEQCDSSCNEHQGQATAASVSGECDSASSALAQSLSTVNLATVAANRHTCASPALVINHDILSMTAQVISRHVPSGDCDVAVAAEVLKILTVPPVACQDQGECECECMLLLSSKYCFALSFATCRLIILTKKCHSPCSTSVGGAHPVQLMDLLRQVISISPDDNIADLLTHSLYNLACTQWRLGEFNHATASLDYWLALMNVCFGRDLMELFAAISNDSDLSEVAMSSWYQKSIGTLKFH